MEYLIIIVIVQFVSNLFLTYRARVLYAELALLKSEKLNLEKEFDHFVELYNSQELQNQDAMGEKLLDALERELYSQMLLSQEPYGDA
tara:strand:+ start:717 stop:980 length:264 start_codon:yes stop_codon:yes gene_type:complete